MLRSRTLKVAAVALASLTFAACSDEDREDVEEEIESAASEVEEEVESAASEVEEAVGEAASDVAEAAVRNLATEFGEEEFADAGAPLDDSGLSCQATVTDGLDAIDVTCTGTTEDGETAEMTGQTSELPGASVTEVEGSFTGTVDGVEVFSIDDLGA